MAWRIRDSEVPFWERNIYKAITVHLNPTKACIKSKHKSSLMITHMILTQLTSESYPLPRVMHLNMKPKFSYISPRESEWLKIVKIEELQNYEIFLFCDFMFTPVFARMHKIPRKAIRHHGKNVSGNMGQIYNNILLQSLLLGSAWLGIYINLQ